MRTRIENQQLKAFLLDAGTISEGEFDEAQETAKKQGKTVGEVLVQEGQVTEENLKRMQAYILGVPFVNLEDEQIDPTVLRIIPEPIAKQHNIVAFRRNGQTLEVAMLDPQDLVIIDFIKKKSRLKIRPRLTTTKGIKHALQQYSKSLQAEFGDLIQEEVKGIKTVADQRNEKLSAKTNLKKAAEELPIIRIVDTLMKHAILQRASDVHIEPTEKEVLVRYRIDGVLHNAMVLPKQVASGIVARIKVLAALKLDEHRLPQDGRFKVETEGYKYSIRVSILPVFDGEKIVMRLLAEGSQGLTLEQLGLRGDTLEQVERSLKRPIGLILVTGPTGSGKTTTLYSMMEILNTPEVNISTVEDPVEYRMPRVNQTQVRPKIGLSFASGLRSLLRQDPDIIMVGEIRDEETAALAINVALTGHLVLSTLHTTDAAGAIPRLIDMDVEPFLLSSTLSIVIAQRLVRILCDDKEKYKLSEKDIIQLAGLVNIGRVEELLHKNKLLKTKQTLRDAFFYRAKKNKECPDGYKGRIGIYEVLPVTETIKSLIGKHTATSTIRKQAEQEGMINMVEDGFVKAAQGITTVEEVMRVIAE